MPPPPPDKWRVYSTGNEVGQLRQGLVIIYLFCFGCLFVVVFILVGGGGWARCTYRLNPVATVVFECPVFLC